jgi:hypothetical protein
MIKKLRAKRMIKKMTTLIEQRKTSKSYTEIALLGFEIGAIKSRAANYFFSGKITQEDYVTIKDLFYSSKKF